MPPSPLHTVPTSVPGVQIQYDAVTAAEEAYLLEKIDVAGGPAGHGGSVLGDVATDGTSGATRTNKSWGWRDLNGRRSMYWGGTVLPSGSLVPAPFPSFMDGAWPDVLGRIAASGLYDKYTGGKGKGKERGANHCLVNEYLPGQGIMPHTDGPSYHPCTTTLSLGSHTVLCLRSKPSHLDPSSSTAPSEVQKIDIFLPPRSLVVLSGELYSSWLHGIQPLKGDSATSLVGCANWDDWWMWQADQATAEAEAAGDGGETDGTAAAVSTSLSPEAARADVVNRRRMAEEGAGWEREKRISLTCRRVAGKVRKNVLGLR